MIWLVIIYLLVGLLIAEAIDKRRKVYTELWVIVLFIIFWVPFMSLAFLIKLRSKKQ